MRWRDQPPTIYYPKAVLRTHCEGANAEETATSMSASPRVPIVRSCGGCEYLALPRASLGKTLHIPAQGTMRDRELSSQPQCRLSFFKCPTAQTTQQPGKRAPGKRPFGGVPIRTRVAGSNWCHSLCCCSPGSQSTEMGQTQRGLER